MDYSEDYYNCMMTCWKKGFKLPKVMEYFSDQGIYITEYDVQDIFSYVFEKENNIK